MLQLEFHGIDEYSDRTAKVIYEDGFIVICFDKGKRIKTIVLFAYSQEYAENAAENWVTGIIQN